MNFLKKMSFKGTINILFFVSVAAAGAVFLASSMKTNPNSEGTEIGRVLEKKGSVEAKTGRAQGWSPVGQEAPIYDKTSVYAGENSEASIRVRNTVVQIGEKTLIQVIDPQKKTELFMDSGSLHLSSDKTDQVILNVGGEKIKISLNASKVSIKKEKKTGKLNIVSVSGPIQIESDKRARVELSAGKELNLDIQPAVETAEVEKIEAPKPELKLHYESVYENDSDFTRRPALKLSILSEVASVQYEVSKEGQVWTSLTGDTFKPDHDGDYYVRARGHLADGGELISKTSLWKPEFNHFELKQPVAQHARFLVDPTKQEHNILFSKSNLIAKNVEFDFEDGKSVSLNAENGLPISEIPAGTKEYRVLDSANLPFTIEKKNNPLEVEALAPKPVLKNGEIRLKPVVQSQYFYEAYDGNDDKVLDIQNGVIHPDCKKNCTVKIRYKSHLNPEWSSAEASVQVKAPEVVVRKMASNDTAVMKTQWSPEDDKIRVQQPWMFEFGLGGNYINMNTSSSLTSASTNGLNGPTLFLSTQRQYDDATLKASLLDVHTKMNTSASGQPSSSQSMDWRTMWAGVLARKWGFLPRLEFGLAYQDMPLFYQDSTGAGKFENGHMLAGTVGFNSTYDLSEMNRIVWEQRVLLPVSSSASGQIDSFSPKYGIDGSLTYYHCLQNDWGIGASWLGQYTQANFKLRPSGTLVGDSPSSTMFNSNFQVRLQYGACNYVKR